MQKIDSGMQWVLLVGVVTILCLSMVGVMKDRVECPTAQDIADLVDVPTESAIVDGVLAGIVIPEITVPEMPDTLLSVRDEKKILAEELCDTEFDSNDFIDELLERLNKHKNINIEDEDDIDSVVVSDVDVRLAGRDIAYVTYTLKVRYFNDGDNDEEDMEKCKVEVELKVVDLDRDDDYEDAEMVDVDEYFEYVFIKLYD